MLNRAVHVINVAVNWYSVSPTKLTKFVLKRLKKMFLSKIEEIPSDAQGEKSEKLGKFGKTGLNNMSINKYQKGTEPGIRRGKHSLLVYHTRCKCSMDTTHNYEKVKLGIKVKSLIGLKVTVTDRVSEWHLPFARRILHIASWDPSFDHNTSWLIPYF